MFLKIDPKGATPIYIQIIEQVKYQVASGRLRVGDRIPTVRELAVQLRINPNTVAKAYRELDREEILEGRPGRGSYIKSGGPGLSMERRLNEVSRLMETPIVQAYHLNLDRRAVTNIFQKKLGFIYSGAEAGEKGASS